MKRERVDIFFIRPEQSGIHDRLVNWANWVRVRPHYAISPMFKALGYKSNSRQWEAPTPRVEVNTSDAWIVEKAVCALPERWRIALVWFYVTRWPGVFAMRQKLAVTEDGLQWLCNSARDMLDNRLRRDTMAAAYTHGHQSRREAGVSSEFRKPPG